MAAKKLSFNEYIIEGDITRILITRKDGKLFETIVNTYKIPFLKELNYHWHIWEAKNGNYYVRYTKYFGMVDGKPKYRLPYLHHFLMDGEEYNWNIVYDHINHNTLDNRVENLRVLPRKENCKNRSRTNSNNKTGYRNICEYGGKLLVQLQVDGKNKKLGTFELDELDRAIIFAEEMRQKYYGKFAGNN